MVERLVLLLLMWRRRRQGGRAAVPAAAAAAAVDAKTATTNSRTLNRTERRILWRVTNAKNSVRDILQQRRGASSQNRTTQPVDCFVVQTDDDSFSAFSSNSRFSFHHKILLKCSYSKTSLGDPI